MEEEEVPFTCRDWFCLLNPCYRYDEDEGEDFLLISPTSVEPLREQDCGDPFFLTDSFDAMEEYYALFDRLDCAERSGLSSIVLNSALSLMSTVSAERLSEAASVLGSLSSQRQDVAHALSLYLTAIRACENSSPRRMELIKEYESFRNIHSSVAVPDMHQSRWFIDNARATTNSKELRLLYYQKALFFTHGNATKIAYQTEYKTYCENLRKRRTIKC